MSTDTTLSSKDAAEWEMFLVEVREGARPLHAANAVGWSPAKLKRLMKDPEFAELLGQAEEMVDETVEMSLLRSAKKGNFRAQQMWLLNRQAGRWRDIRHLEVTASTQLDIGVIHSVKEGLLEVLRSNGPGALQDGGALDAIEASAADVD